MQVASDVPGLLDMSPEAVAAAFGVSKQTVLKVWSKGKLVGPDGRPCTLRFAVIGPQVLRTSRDECLRFVRELNAARTLPVNLVPKPADVDGPAGELVELDADDLAEDAAGEQ